MEPSFLWEKGRINKKKVRVSEIKKTAKIDFNTELKKKIYPADVKCEPILI